MLPELKTMPRVPAAIRAILKATHSPCYPIELVVSVVLVVVVGLVAS